MAEKKLYVYYREEDDTTKCEIINGGEMVETYYSYGLGGIPNLARRIKGRIKDGYELILDKTSEGKYRILPWQERNDLQRLII